MSAKNHILIAAQHVSRLTHFQHMDLCDSILATLNEQNVPKIDRYQLANALMVWSERNSKEDKVVRYGPVERTETEPFICGAPFRKEA